MRTLGEKTTRYARKFGEKLNGNHLSLGSKVSYQNKYNPTKDGQNFMNHKKQSPLEKHHFQN